MTETQSPVMRISITDVLPEGYRWVLEMGPNDCLMESGREKDLQSCMAAIERTRDELWEKL